MDLSVIILSYNTKDITSRCLDKLNLSKEYCEKKMNNKIEVIVIDNGSEDGSDQMINQDHPWVKLIALKENSGFSEGNNIGMEKTSYPYILLLNSDVYLEEESLYKALAYFRVNLNCAVLGAKLTYASGKIQPSAGNLPNPLNIIFWILGLSLFSPFDSSAFHPRGKSYFKKAHKVGWVMGAFFMLKREVYKKTDGFDENIFLYLEEVEWCKRIKDLGFNVWYNPQVEAVHLHGASSSFNMSTSFLNELKGIKYYLKKHYKFYYLVIKLFLILGLILRVIAFTLLGKTQRARVYVEGIGVI